MMAPDPREPRLPKWAQERLFQLRREVESLTQVLRELQGQVPETDTFISDYVRGDTPLPPGARIDFQMMNDGRSTDTSQRIQVYIGQEGGLEIQGGRAVRIEPRASNSLRIYLERR
ncbi:hypothetical protein PP629_gp29 [Streptomyces phage Dubu]|uniref:Uncharacterized protein n=1 Tax=Streptomyces phage Dubu TaxID=2591226 RepID=A0A514DEU2_9CAUD|nr:hypothetical protein PP629_gp29 [Streptomyces phage Dubu]QDH92134.1 hypothetical protein SEA_DUBU_29 [Streptomyces phage Dubu]